MKLINKLQKIYDSLEKNIDKKDLSVFKKAFDFALNKYNEDRNPNGELIIVYVTRSALLLSKISNDLNLIISCLFRDILTYTTKKELKKEFGEELSILVANVTEISDIKYNEGKTKKNLALFYEVFKKSGNDIRIFLVKICLRVDYIQNFGILSEERKKIIANETLDIYIPLIKTFSLVKYFPNIEDQCYKFIKPQEFNEINKILENKKDFLDKKIKNIKKEIKKISRKYNFDIKIESRIKSVYSIHRKMEAKKIPISGIYDLIAFRIIVEKKKEAYEMLWLVHSIFKSKENRIKDYISSPKKNGYQSIHTTVIDSDGYIFEIQIQTKQMYEFNIFGLASHNSYKGITENFEIFPQWMKKMYSNQKKNLFKDTFINSFDISIFTDQITCFTHTGERLDLPKGSTILDCAFKLHTKIGNRVTGAWINGEYIDNLIHILNNGDKVHLSLSDKELEYPVKFISYVKTKTAKRNLKSSFKNKSNSKINLLGKHLLNEKMELLGYKSFELMPVLIKNKIFKYFNIDNLEEFYIKIGMGKIQIDKVLSIIYNLKNDETKYKSIVGLSIIFKHKSPENINALFKVFHDLDINIVNIKYKGITTDAEVNVKNTSLLRDLIIEISRIPNVFRVKRILSKRMIIFIVSLILTSIWIFSTPFLLFFLKNHYNISEFLCRGLFYFNIIFLISLLYFYKYIVKATLPGMIKEKFFWIAMFLLNTFTLISIVWEAIFIFKTGNLIFLFSLILILYGLTTFEYLDSKINNYEK